MSGFHGFSGLKGLNGLHGINLHGLNGLCCCCCCCRSPIPFKLLGCFAGICFYDFEQLFQKWLPRANHYAHETRREILSRTPVCPFSEIPHHDVKTIRKPLKIVSWPECQPEFQSDSGGDGVPTTLPIWSSSWAITPRDQISCTGNLSLPFV